MIVDDRVDVALAADADGVHVGQRDLDVRAVRKLTPPDFVVGVSTHDRHELLAASADGADYAGLGAFFETDTKTTTRPLDPETAGVAEPLAGLEIPVLAIGGITADRLARALEVPAVTGVAVSGAIQRADDVERSIAGLRSRIDEIWIEQRRGDR